MLTESGISHVDLDEDTRNGLEDAGRPNPGPEASARLTQPVLEPSTIRLLPPASSEADCFGFAIKPAYSPDMLTLSSRHASASRLRRLPRPRGSPRRCVRCPMLRLSIT